MKTFIKENWQFLISVSLAFIVCLLLCSCGTRSTSKEYHEITSKNTFNDSSFILTQNVRLNDIGELFPIDNTKPFFVDGKEYFNVSIKFDKSKFEDLKLEHKNIGTVTGSSEIKSNQATDRKDNTMLWLGIVLIIVVAIFAWFYLPRIKSIK